MFEVGLQSEARSRQAKLKKIANPSNRRGKLLGVLSHVVSEKTQSTLREEGG